MLTPLVALFVIGHLKPGPLHPIRNFISQYASSAPWAWMFTGCMLLLGVAYTLVAFGLIRTLHHNDASASAALLLAIAGALLGLVVLYPTHVLKTDVGSLETSFFRRVWDDWTGTDVQKAIQKAIDKAHNDNVAAVHQTMITFSLGVFMLAQISLAAGLWRDPLLGLATRLTLLLALPAFLAFASARHFLPIAGLLQRTGFVLVLVWLFHLGRRLLEMPVATRVLPPSSVGEPGQ